MNEKAPELVLLGETIRALREAQGFSQYDFAYEAGIGTTFYGRLERGEVNPTILSLIKVARALNVDVKELLPDALME